MTNPNQHNQAPGSHDTAPSPTQAQPSVAQPSELQQATTNTPTPSPLQVPSPLGNTTNHNTPLAGSLNSKPPLFFIRATASQLKAIIQSAPRDVRSRIRANASKEAMLDEVFKLRQQEAIAAAENPQDPISSKDALQKLLTMDARDVPIAVDTCPDNVRSLMEAALRGDHTLTPRTVPEDRNNIIYTILAWQVNAHKSSNPQLGTGANTHTNQPTQVPDQQPPRAPTTNRQNGTNEQTTPTLTGFNIQTTLEPARQPSADVDQAGPTLNDVINAVPTVLRQQGEPIDPDDSDEEHEMRRKRAREANPMETWIQGFHTGADAALEQTLSTYPENRPGANRLNVSTFRGPKILGKVISRGMGLQQHVATFPFWRKAASGRPTQPQMEAHNLARMMQLEILAHKSPLEALRHRPSLEVGLRRLYAIMYVEKQISTGEMLDRGAAWQNINFLLEATPSDISTCDDIEEEMTRRLTQSKRRIAATKAIKESDTRRPKRGPPNKGNPPNQDGNKRRNHGPDQDHKE